MYIIYFIVHTILYSVLTSDIPIYFTGDRKIKFSYEHFWR